MDNLQNAILLAGVASVGMLWLFSVIGGMHTVWETFSDHASDLVERLKR